MRPLLAHTLAAGRVRRSVPDPIFYMALHTAIMQASSVITSEVSAEAALGDRYLSTR
jgi:hypothetical protein